MVSFLGDASCLQVFTLNLYGLDQENLHRYATLGFLPETLKSLRLYGNDDSLNAIMKGLRKHQLQSLALKGLSSYSLLGTLLEEQKLSEIELGHTTVDPFLCSLDMACKLPALLTIESLSITVPVNHNHILKSLRHHQGRLTYLSIAVRSLPDDAELTRLNNLYFGKAKNLKYLVLKIVEYLIPKFPLSAAIMAERFSDAGIRTKTVRDLNEIAWPMLSRVTGEYARSQA
ncbi:hypothetical protein LZ31DRAFT_561438 [Colletotrichum somersetense]|nr:hypothetical protein LZ31DRAFT_561438 [Colletotrichum somersetense]